MNALVLLPGSMPLGEGLKALASAPFEKGQTSIETEFGWLDGIKATRTAHPTTRQGYWRLTGWYTAK